VALAEKTPAKFSPTLREELEKLSGAVLVEGLKYTHPKENVNALIREHLRAALSTQDGHTPKSAQALLELAQAEKDRVRKAWIDLLARDKAGRPVLVAFIDGAAKDERRLEAMLAYVDHAGKMTPSEIHAAIRNHSIDFFVPTIVPPDMQPIVARYVDEIWALYLSLRKDEGNHERLRLLGHIRTRREYDERFLALLRPQIEAGEIPPALEIVALGDMARGNPQIARAMLRWSDTSNVTLRHLLSGELLLALEDAKFTREELPQVRKMLIAGALESEESADNSYPYFLISYLDGLSADEARQVAKVATDAKGSQDRYRNELLFNIAEPYPEYRGPLISRLTGADLEDVEQAIGFAEHTPPWMAAFAAKWIQERTSDELRNEATQERFLVLSRLLSRDIRDRVRLPKTRRAHAESGIYHCYMGPVMAYQAAVAERQDLVAFGLPLPEKTPKEQVPEAGRPGYVEENKVPAAPPLTPQEATVRWQQFVMARESVLRHLAKEQKK
jgi:hypothetical protein